MEYIVTLLYGLIVLMLADKSGDEWPTFSTLIRHVHSAIKVVHSCDEQVTRILRHIRIQNS